MNRKSIKALLFTIMLILSISFMTFPKSYPKFMTKEENALVYNIEMNNPMYAGTGTINRLPSSTPKSVHLEFSFDRNPNTLNLTSETNPDTYTVTIPDSCVIMKIKSTGKYYISSGRVVFYNSNPDNVTVTMSCEVNVLKGEKYLETSIEVNEEINDQNFKYMDFYYKEPIENYPVVELSTVMEWDTLKDGSIEDMYKAYINWIENKDNGYAYSTNYANTVINYIGSKYFTSADKLVSEANNSTRPGLIISKVGEIYKFELEPNNIVGYARTLTLPNSNPYLYFSAMNVENITESNIAELNEAFEKYLEYKLYPGDENKEVRAKVMNYLLAQAPQGIYSVLNKSVTVGGLYTTANKDTLTVVADVLKQYALAAVDYKEMQITKDTVDSMTQTTKAVLKTIDDKIISSSLKEYLNKGVNYRLITDFITKNNTENGKNETFTDYTIMYDSGNKQYLLVKIYSNETEEYSHVEFDTIKFPSGMVYKKFTNTYNEFSINLSYKTSSKTVYEDIEKVVTELSNKLGNIKTKTVTEVLDSNGKKTGEYLIDVVIEKEVPIAYENEIQFGTTKEMKESTNNIINGISDKIISQDLKNYLKKNDSIITNYTTKNNTDNEEKISFNDYISLYDGTNKHYVMIKVSSNKVSNKIEINTIKTLENMTMNDFTNTEDNLNVIINYTPNETQKETFEQDVTDIINKITWFTGNITSKEIVEKLDSEGNKTGEYVINFNVKKTINIEYQKEIQFGTIDEMKQSFISSIDEINDTIISQDLKNIIKNDESLISYVTKNNNDLDEKITFNDYVSIYDTANNNYLLIKVSSNGNNNRIEIAKFGLLDNMSMTFTNSDEHLDVTITYTPNEIQMNTLEQDIDFTVNELSLFIGRVVNKTVLEKLDSDNNGTGEYTVNFLVNK